MKNDRCDIIIPTFGQPDLIRNCIESLRNSTHYPYRLIIVDNARSAASSDLWSTYKKLPDLDIVVIQPGENLGWLRSINKALEISKDSPYVLFQNDDTLFVEGWLEEMVAAFNRDPGIGIANPAWETPKGTSAEDYAAAHKGKVIDTDWCRGHSFFVRREVIDRLGGFDTAYLPFYYEERDYSLKAIAAGYRCVMVQGAFVHHVRNATVKRTMLPEDVKSIQERNGKIFYKRWGYPLRLVCVFKDPACTGEFLRTLCMDQNKVIVIARSGRDVPYEHTNLKVIYCSRRIFHLRALAFLAGKRSSKKQKAVEYLFTDDNVFNDVVKFVKMVISFPVVFESDFNLLKKRALELVKRRKEYDKKASA